METRYYYLVTGLPDLLLDEGRGLPSWNALYNEISESLDEAEAALLPLLKYPADNANLITLLEKKERPFSPFGNFTREALEAEIKSPYALPSYAVDFLSAARDNRLPFPSLCREDQLAWLFYDFAALHPQAFIRGWFTFELNLRNTLAALNCRDLAAATGQSAAEWIERTVLCRNEVSALLLKSGAPDFSLSPVFREIDAVLALPRGDPADFEKGVDALRWRVLDDLTFLSDFSIDVVLAFLVKLDMARRWASLSSEAGQRRLAGLVGQLKGKLTL